MSNVKYHSHGVRISGNSYYVHSQFADVIRYVSADFLREIVAPNIKANWADYLIDIESIRQKYENVWREMVRVHTSPKIDALIEFCTENCLEISWKWAVRENGTEIQFSDEVSCGYQFHDNESGKTGSADKQRGTWFPCKVVIKVFRNENRVEYALYRMFTIEDAPVCDPLYC